jgi:hypothetical protein
MAQHQQQQQQQRSWLPCLLLSASSSLPFTPLPSAAARRCYEQKE